MTQSISWLRYRAKDGILETHFHADGGWGGYSRFVEKALTISESDMSECNSEYRLLDTFFSDSMSEVLLEQIFQRASDSSPVRMLVVDPTCPFAEHRAKSIGGTAFERAHKGLKIIATALKIHTNSKMNTSDPADPALLALIHQVEEKAHVNVHFYSVTPSGPLYFFKNIVLCGRFCSGESAIRLPWSMVINDPYRDDDLFDILKNEFEDVWNSSYKYPGSWATRKRQVFLSYSELDHVLAEEIRQRLQDKHIDCFMASHSLSPGEIWTDELRKSIHSSVEFVVLLTSQSATSAWVQAELGAAWALNLNITPAFVEARMPEILQFVGSRHAINISTTAGKERLINAIQGRMLKRFGNYEPINSSCL